MNMLQKLLGASGLPALLTLILASAAMAQIDSVVPSEGTLSTVIRLTGDLGSKPKPVFVLDGVAVKKTKLKVVGSGVDAADGGQYVDVEVNKALAGTYQIALSKKALETASIDTFTVRPPVIQSVTPDTAAVGESVDVIIEYAVLGKRQMEVGGVKAKVTDSVPLAGDGGGPLTQVTLIVPKVANGTWPVRVVNGVGQDILKSALTVTGGATEPGKKPAAQLFKLDEKGKYKAIKAKLVSLDEQPTETAIGVVAGNPSKPKATLTFNLPVLIDGIVEGVSFPGEPGSVLYTEKGKGNVINSYAFSEGDEWSTEVVTVTADLIAFFVCGHLSRTDGTGPEELELFGTIISPAGEEPLEGVPCEPAMSAEMSTTGAFAANSDLTNGIYHDMFPPLGRTFLTGLQPVVADGAGNYGFQMEITYNPNTQGNATITGVTLLGEGLSSFRFTESDGTQWTQAADFIGGTTSMTVEITSNTASTNPNDGANGYLQGTFSGTVGLLLDPMTTQTVSGTFCVPWSNDSDILP